MFLILAIFLAGSSTVNAQSLGTFNFDENGNGTWLYPSGGSVSLPGTPITGGGVLYDLSNAGIPYPPFQTYLGAIWGFDEPNTTPLVLSDVIVFGGLGGNSSNPNQFQYYSDARVGDADMADLITGTLEQKFGTLGVYYNEVGSEGDNYIEVGIIPAGTTDSFIMHGISDVPEPGTIWLLVAGGVGLLAIRRLRRKA
jgi:hypothetical protein